MEVYLDNSATTKPGRSVLAVMQDALVSHWHNPSALYRPSMEAEKLVTAAREVCLKAVNAQGHRLIFTSGGTEADNIAILGHLRTLHGGGRVLLSSVEHPAILACAQEISRLGFQVEEIAVDRRGVIDLEKLEAQLKDDVRMICVMQVNNESGAVMPLKEIITLRDRLCPACAIHVDGVQGYLRVPLDLRTMKIQSYAFSGHKIHACKGVGGLIVRKDHKISPIVYGGGQEDGYRSGTENTPGILAMSEAVRSYPADGAERMMEMKRQLWQLISDKIPGAILNGPALDDPACAPHILNVSLMPVRSQTMLFALEGQGIYVSAGSACSSKKQKVSGVLTAMGMSTQQADCALRFSFCPDNTPEEMVYVAEAIEKQYALLSRYVRR